MTPRNLHDIEQWVRDELDRQMELELDHGPQETEDKERTHARPEDAEVPPQGGQE